MLESNWRAIRVKLWSQFKARQSGCPKTAMAVGQAVAMEQRRSQAAMVVGKASPNVAMAVWQKRFQAAIVEKLS